jgi:hypothetical protein
MGIIKRVAGGAEAGVIAGAGVALLFLVQDVVQLQPLSTPVALAEGLLGPGTAPVDGALLGRVAGYGVLGVKLLVYSLIHFGVFVGVGVSAAFLLNTASFWASLWGGVAYGTVLCTGLLYGGSWFAGGMSTVGALGVPGVLLVNAMAGAILGVGLHLAQSDEESEAA